MDLHLITSKQRMDLHLNRQIDYGFEEHEQDKACHHDLAYPNQQIDNKHGREIHEYIRGDRELAYLERIGGGRFASIGQRFARGTGLGIGWIGGGRRGGRGDLYTGGGGDRARVGWRATEAVVGGARLLRCGARPHPRNFPRTEPRTRRYRGGSRCWLDGASRRYRDALNGQILPFKRREKKRMEYI
jgi:hypothetical protein